MTQIVSINLISNSLATIAAGTNPPLVTEIIPLKGAISCNLPSQSFYYFYEFSSHETGNDFFVH
jgi:hypothetical protein